VANGPSFRKDPQQGSSREHWIRGAFTLLGVIITAGVTLLAAYIGRATDTIVVSLGPPPTAVQTVVVTAPAAPPAIPTTVERPDSRSGPALPAGVRVRRSTETGAITLRPGFGVDLDNNTSPNWDVHSGPITSSAGGGNDVGFDSSAAALDFYGDLTVVGGSPQYGTCAQETGYTHGSIERGSLRVGESICTRTNQDRYALITVTSVSEQAVAIDVVVWDPPVAS
jgi:hypothetical protein